MEGTNEKWRENTRGYIYVSCISNFTNINDKEGGRRKERAFIFIVVNLSGKK